MAGDVGFNQLLSLWHQFTKATYTLVMYPVFRIEFLPMRWFSLVSYWAIGQGKVTLSGTSKTFF